MLSIVVSLLGLQSSSAHYVYLKEAAPGEAVVTFGEGGVPGSADVLSMIADQVNVMSTVEKTTSQNLTLSTKELGDGTAQLVGTFTAAPPYRLQLAATFGVFRGNSLLKYTSSADVVTTQNDWWDLQDWGMQSGLEITIRDPYANQMSSWSSVSAKTLTRTLSSFPGDQCQPGQHSQDGAACVLAVVRFKGELLDADMNVTTYAGDGSEISTAFQPAAGSGVVIVKVPLNASAPHTEVFARVNYREPSPGEYDGQAYDVVDHWATAYARIARTSDGGIVIV